MWTTLVNKIKSGIEWTGLYYFDGGYTYNTIELDNAPIPARKVDTLGVTSVKATDADLPKTKKPRKPRAKKAATKKTKKS